MRRKLVFATNNQHKLKEVSAILGDEIGIMSLEDINCYADIPETADTLEGNALLKAEFVHNNYKSVKTEKIISFGLFFIFLAVVFLMIPV